ncbi:MAG: nucleotidyltransferase family protein [Actinomycetota bacterium]
MTGVLDVVAGWDLADGVVDDVEPFEVDRHLPLVIEHRLTGVLLAAVRAGDIHVDAPAAVFDAHESAMAQALLLEDTMLDAVEALADAGIRAQLLKGAAIAHLLPDPGLRVFGDTDLLVPSDRLGDAAAALEPLGAGRAQAAVSPDWERRFAKSVTLRWRSATEIDLHRTLAPGPYGHLVDLAELERCDDIVSIGGVGVPTLSPELHLVHAALHVALGDVAPRLGNVRDIAVLLERTDLDVDRVMRTVVRWGAEAPFARGVAAAGAIGARHAVVDWAHAHRPRGRDRRLLASYEERNGRFRRQTLASLSVVPWRDKPALVRSLTTSRRG